MRIRLIFTSGLLALSACAPLNIYYKPGASVAVAQRQTTACKVDALAKVPVSTQIVREPPYYVPPRLQCNNEGQCVTIPGYYEPGEIYTVDRNLGLRKQVEVQCMADAGFAPVSIPPCPQGVAKAAPVRATATLPPLSEKSCVIRNRDGSFQIVNQG